MAVKFNSSLSQLILERRVRKTTSIGKSTRSRPKNKHKKRSFKKYRGQG